MLTDLGLFTNVSDLLLMRAKWMCDMYKNDHLPATIGNSERCSISGRKAVIPSVHS